MQQARRIMRISHGFMPGHLKWENSFYIQYIGACTGFLRRAKFDRP
jgi:hypothetical protein